MTSAVFEAGPNQIIVVYSPPDMGTEIDVSAAFGAIATDAADRFTGGWRMVSTAALPTRHAQAFMGREGSGYETKMSIVVVYAKP